jgi:hypothetical protein
MRVPNSPLFSMGATIQGPEELSEYDTAQCVQIFVHVSILFDSE